MTEHPTEEPISPPNSVNHSLNQVMDAADELSNVHEHGVSVEKRRVKCRYCDKTMTNYSRLKAHLGGVGTDVKACDKVPDDVKSVFRKMLYEKGSAIKKIGKKSILGLPQKRISNSTPNSNGAKHTKVIASSDSWNSVSMVEDDPAEASSAENEPQVCANLEKCIGRFFFEMGIDVNVANSNCFQEMINAALSADMESCKTPTSRELKGRIFQNELAEMNEYILSVKATWEVSGCSLLIDGWIDDGGRELVMFIADCPRGPVYIRAADVTFLLSDTDALQSLLDSVIDEVGSANVVQVVASSCSGWMADVRRQFMERNSTAIWSVSASYCVRLMLESIKSMAPVKRALDEAKIIAKFIYSHADALKLFKSHTSGKDLLDPSWMDFAVPFFTLERINANKANLEKMIASFEWGNLASGDGKRVSELITDSTFWSSVEKALNSSIPLLRVHNLINEAEKPFMGYIYETIDQAKEQIKEEFEGKRTQYQPVWDAIDNVWNNHLHSFLHGAGYYLNPSIYYSDDFYQDDEVAYGLLCCVVRMVRNKHEQDLISVQQLEKYRTGKGTFEEGSSAENRNNRSPVQWWAEYGGQCPELQSFAIRVLSQTCDGASRYKLNRHLAEKVVSERNPAEQARLADVAAVHYNLHLRKFRTDR